MPKKVSISPDDITIEMERGAPNKMIITYKKDTRLSVTGEGYNVWTLKEDLLRKLEHKINMDRMGIDA